MSSFKNVSDEDIVADLDRLSKLDPAKKTERIEKLESSLGTIENEIKELKAKGGRISANNANDQTNPLEVIKSFISKNADKLKNFNSGDVITEKVVGTMSTGNMTGTIPAFFNSKQPLVPADDFNLRDLFGTTYTDGRLSIIYPRTKTPLGEGSFGRQTEGQTKAQMDYDLENVTLTLDYRAGFTRVTRQVLDNIEYLQNYVTQRLRDSYFIAENRDFYNEINSVAGTAGSTSETLTVSKIIAYIGQMRKLKYRPNMILTSWEAWTQLMLTMPSPESGFSTPAIFTVTPEGIVKIGGVPFVAHTEVAANKIFVMDTRVIERADAKSLNFRASEHDGNNFVENKITFRLEAASELMFYDPKGILYGTTGS